MRSGARLALEQVGADIRYAVRGLRRAPGFAITAVVTLALAVGATTAILSVVDVVLLRPLPYVDSDRLYTLWGTSGVEADRIQPSYPDFEDWRERSGLVEVGFARGDGFLYRDGELTENLLGAMVSPGFFDVLGARPAIGRGFAPGEERAGAARVVVLSHALWTNRFARDRGVIGRSLTLGEASYVVVGVMPPGVAYPEWAQMWMPIASAGAADVSLRERGNRVDNRAIARLSAGVARAAASAELSAIAERLAAEYPATNRGLGLRLAPMREDVVGETRTPLLVMLAAAALVLLIACANIANLLLARATGRVREMAVRRALGAVRGRIARQLLTESVVLAVVGGALGVVLARLLLDLLVAVGPGELPAFGLDLPYLAAVGLDVRVLGVVAGLTLLTGLIFGAAPAVLAAKASPILRLRGGGDARGTRLQSGLVVAQLALAVTLLGGAGLLLRSYGELNRVDPGFRPDDLVILRLLPPPERYATAGARGALYDRIADRAAAIPGVRAATLINHMPMTRAIVTTQLRAPGSPPAEQPPIAAYRTVAEDFFQVTGVRVVRGRGFTAQDQAPGSGSLIINEALAAILWRDEDAVGRSLNLLNPTQGSPRFGEEISGTVIGIVADTRQALGSPPWPAVYVPLRWEPWGNMVLVLRADRAPAGIVAAVRRAVLELEPNLPVADVTPMRQVIRDSLMREAFQARLMLGFASLALVLGLVGIYGVLSHLVARRSREIGIRMAIGAAPGDVRRLIVGGAARLIALGVVMGLAGAHGLARVMEGMLFGVTTVDVVTFIAVPAVIMVTALLAIWVPVAKASRTDPNVVLRTE